MSRFFKTVFLALFLPVIFLAGCQQKIKASEPPEEVVKRFYAYIKEGGPTTLGEAYRLIDTRVTKVDEETFKKTVGSYPKDMDVNVLKSFIDDKDGKAVVTIEYRTASAFGDYIVNNTDINLTLDKAAKSWKIDYSGDTYDESPATYSDKK